MKQTGVFGSKSGIWGRFICLKLLHERLKSVIDMLKLLKGISLLDVMPIYDLFVRILHRSFTGYSSLAWVFVHLLSEDQPEKTGLSLLKVNGQPSAAAQVGGGLLQSISSSLGRALFVLSSLEASTCFNLSTLYFRENIKVQMNHSAG